MLTAILIFVAILIFAIFIIRPEISLYTMAFCLPIIGWSFYIGKMFVPFIDLVSLLALTAFFSRLLYQLFFKTSNKIKLKWPLFFPFAVIILINILSAYFSSDSHYSLYYTARWIVFLYFAYIFLPYNLITSGKILKRTIWAIVLSSVLMLFNGYLSLLGQDWHDSFFRLQSIKILGIYPYEANQNLIAEFLNVGAFLILVLRILSKKIKIKRLLDILFFLTSLGIILTFSRAGWISLFLQILVYSIYSIKKQNLRWTYYAVIVFTLLTLSSPLVWKMTQLQKNNSTSNEDRLLLTTIAAQALSESPYLGKGSGQFINLVASNTRFRAKYGEPIDSHGLIQKIGAENGLFGLAAWLFLIICLTEKLYSALKKYQTSHPWLLPMILAATGGLFFQIFNTSYYRGKVWLPIAMTLAAINLLDAKYAGHKK